MASEIPTSESMVNFKYTSGDISAVFITVPNNDISKTLARALVEKKLAGCVNIIPSITSVYQWEGKINEDSEAMMIVKTRTSKIPELTEFVKKNHPYTVAEVISFKIEYGNLPYLKWITDSVP